MNGKLFAEAIIKVISGVLLMGILLFIPAGSFSYWNGWLLMAVLFVPMIVAGFVMMKKNPELLQKRLNAKEEQSEQKTVIVLSGLMFLAAFVVAGLNFRFGWIVL
ncbi:MAG: isoprenylcysteine carboxylmethyltransferase family protein, partial [Lachnospiraceae bacterium]|nr:isoprenylcysteine carboxylmethyltransferase family protein [Lachnospiraceae bacterium]